MRRRRRRPGHGIDKTEGMQRRRRCQEQNAYACASDVPRLARERLGGDRWDVFLAIARWPRACFRSNIGHQGPSRKRQES
eukprot:gene20449-biopygen2572